MLWNSQHCFVVVVDDVFSRLHNATRCHCPSKVTWKEMLCFDQAISPILGTYICILVKPAECLEGWHAHISDFPFSKTVICFCAKLSVSVWRTLNFTGSVGEIAISLVRLWFRTRRLKNLVFEPDCSKSPGSSPHSVFWFSGAALGLLWTYHRDSGMIAWNRKQGGGSSGDGHKGDGLCSVHIRSRRERDHDSSTN